MLLGRLPGARATVAAVLALAALAACGSDGNPNRPSPSPPPSGSAPVHYTAIGASDAVGIGASTPCVPFTDCSGGTGYVPVIARRLAAGREVTTMNLGIPAAVIGPEIQQLGQQYGRTIPANFLDQEVPFVPRDTTLLTVFAGANDVNAIGAAAEAGAGGADPRAFLDQQIGQFRTSYDALLGGVRGRAPAARIVVANLPNMAALPYASGYSRTRRQGLQRLSVGFSQEVINRLGSQNVVVVDLLCDPRSYDRSNYASDGFHPNDRGYAFMADLFLDAILSDGPPAPAASCAQTTVVPPL